MARTSTHVTPKGFVGTARHYLGDLVYGANDGVVTTFAAIAGVEGGALSGRTVLIVGTANLVADGISMGIGNYLAIRSRENAREADGLPEDESEPARHGLATFVAFVIAGAVPLVPYLVPLAGSRRLSATLFTFAALFAVGVSRGILTGQAWWKTGVEVLALGAAAGAAAYYAGALIAALV